MTALATLNPLPQYFDLDGSPLSAGKIWFGQPFQNPEINPITVYWDAAATQPAAQPIRTLNGWPMRAGKPAVIYTNGDYSITVRDKRGRLVVYEESSAYFSNDQMLKDMIDDLSSSFSNTTNPALGAGLIAFKPSLNYVKDAIGWYLKNAVPAVIANWYGITGDGVTDWTTEIQAVIDMASAAKRPVLFLNGTYITQTLDLVDRRIGLQGESVLGTILKAPAGFTDTLVSMLNTTNNGGDTFERIENLTLLGTYGVGSVGLDQALCSRAVLRDVRVQGFDAGVRRVNCFCMYDENAEINDCRTDLHLVGSNHNSEHVRCSYIGAGSSWGGTGTCVLITNNGADGLQSSLAFRGCDFEFGGTNASGVVAAMTGTLLLDNCYSEALGATIVQMNDGHCDVLGGEFIIKDATGYLADVVGGNASIAFDDEASISSDGVSRLNSFLIKPGGAGQVTFLRTNIFRKLITNNVLAIPPNLGRSVLSASFLKPMGRQFAKTDYTGVSTVLDTGDTRRVTCTTAGTTGVYQAFTVQPRINANCALVIAYRSNVNFTATVVGGPGQSGTVGTIGTLVNSSGNLLYGIFPEAKITAASQLGFEFWRPAWAVGNYLEIVEVWWADAGAIANGQLSLG